MKERKMTKEDWLLVFHILKPSKTGNKKEFVWINPITTIYLVVSMLKIGTLYLIKGKNYEI